MFKKLLTALKSAPTGERLRASLLRGGVWLGGGSVVAQFFRFARNIVLTRLLAPEAFGIMAIVLSLSSMMDSFTEIGMKEALIQNASGHEERYLNSAWWMSLIRGLAIYGVIFAAAPLVAVFYRNPSLTGLTRIALLSIVFSGAMSSRAYAALKHMDFKRWAFIQYGSSIVGTISTVVLAFLLRSVWALAIGSAAEFGILFLFSFLGSPFRPRFTIDRDSVRDLFRFSKGVFGLSFLNLIFMRTDIFVLGKVVSADRLGIYTIATYLAQVPASFVLVLLGQMLMPAYARMQNEHDRINRILGRITAVVAALFMPAVILVALSGQSLLSILYGSRYASAYVPFIIAVVVAFVNIANAQITTVLYALGKPQLHRSCVTIMAIVMIAVIYPLVHYFGIAGAQLAGITAIVVGYVIQLRQISRLTRFSLVRQARTFALVLICSGLILGLSIGIRQGFGIAGAVPTLTYGLVIALVSLVVSSLIIFQKSDESLASLQEYTANAIS